ncbi:MAG TPA: VgrG-related protein [Solirubrobacteraceae bacterium]
MSATTAERHVSLYTILVGGSEIDADLSRRVREVRIQNYLRLPDTCTLAASFPKGESGQGEPIDQSPFEIGGSLEVRLGAREDLTTSTVFKGEIVTLEPRWGAGGVELLVRAYDHSHVLMRSRNVRTFQNQTSSDIVSKVLTEAGFQSQCDPSGEPHDFIQQDNETDWELIWRLADRSGLELVIDGQMASLRKPSSEGATELQWPATLRSFSPRVTAVQQVDEVTLRAQDPKTKQAIDVSASTPQQVAQIGVARTTVAGAFDSAKTHIATEPVKSQAEGTSVAQAKLDRLANAYVAIEASTSGNPKIRAGGSVKISGVGEQFSGTYPVTQTVHIFRGGSTYETSFSNLPINTLLAATGSGRGAGQPSFGSQLVLGVVTNNQDPENMGRVRVQYPALAADAEGTWARIATLSAGKERGTLMLPVVGEEVLVGFEHDDTTRPYVLGSLFNGQDMPGDDLLHSQDGSFVVLSDKQILAASKEDFSLTSGGKLLIEIADNVEEKYKQDWTNETTGKASLKATQPFEIDGQNVTITGQAQIQIEGSAMVTLKCGGTQIQLSSAGVQISGPMITLG